MGKLSISVPADVERELRARAKAEGRTISALLTTAARRDFSAARNVVEAQRLIDEAIAVHGPPTPEQIAEFEANWAEAQAWFVGAGGHEPGRVAPGERAS